MIKVTILALLVTSSAAYSATPDTRLDFVTTCAALSFVMTAIPDQAENLKNTQRTIFLAQVLGLYMSGGGKTRITKGQVYEVRDNRAVALANEWSKNPEAVQLQYRVCDAWWRMIADTVTKDPDNAAKLVMEAPIDLPPSPASIASPKDFNTAMENYAGAAIQTGSQLKEMLKKELKQ